MIFIIFAFRSPVQGSTIGASQFHTASRRLQRAKTTCKTPPRRATIAPEASRMPQDAPKTVPETPKTLPDGTREAKNVENLSFCYDFSGFLVLAPLRLQEGPRWPQDGRRWPQEGSKGAQDGPMRAPRGPQLAPRGLQEGPRLSLIHI